MEDSQELNTDAAPRWRISEDWLAVIVAGVILIAVLGVAAFLGQSTDDGISHPLRGALAKPGEWDSNPLNALSKTRGILGAWIVCAGIACVAGGAMGKRLGEFVPSLISILGLATLAYVLAGQSVLKYYNLEYALWALLVGLLISNTIGAPRWLRSAALTEFYIKTGLVLLGAEILFGRLLALGLPGICVAWIVTPIVLITTFWFGQRILRIESPSLNMVISADMSVCGVSAAIATAAACRAKKEELSLAIGLSLSFTVLMMVVMPRVITALGMGSVLGGAWLGGTIDSTGAVAAAGAMLDERALEVAATVKMIQNILIGVIAFAVAWYWVQFREQSVAGEGAGGEQLSGEQLSGEQSSSLGIGEVWRRFPRFVLGFAAMSILFSLLAGSGAAGEAIANATTGTTKVMREWLFCLGFVSIGLETHFRSLAHQMKGGKPLILYLVGQSLNLCLTLLMAWIMFVKVFPHLSSPGASQ